MAPKRRDPDKILIKVQPISWARAIVSGLVAAFAMSAFTDIMAMMGVGHFSFELYLGQIVWQGDDSLYRAWLAGAAMQAFLGAVFGILYGWAFEYEFKRSGVRRGLLAGVFHAFFAACFIFPFFSMTNQFIGNELYSHFGFMGIGLGADTFMVLVMAHLIFGSVMGGLYGPVRDERILVRAYEPENSMLDQAEMPEIEPGQGPFLVEGEEPRRSA
jgi:hypothetical protein